MKDLQQQALDHFTNQIEPWDWVGIMRDPDQETIMNIRTQFQHMIHLLDGMIEQKPA